MNGTCAGPAAVQGFSKDELASVCDFVWCLAGDCTSACTLYGSFWKVVRCTQTYVLCMKGVHLSLHQVLFECLDARRLAVLACFVFRRFSTGLWVLYKALSWG